MKQQFTLVIDSGSRHHATRHHPRVVMAMAQDEKTPKDAKQAAHALEKTQAPIFVAFSGDPKDPNYSIVEAMQFNPASKSWEVRAYDFKQKTPPVPDASTDQCVRCHGRDFRPLWPPYPHWAGMIGVGTSLDGDEYDYIKAFAKQADPRYSLLDHANYWHFARETSPPEEVDNAINRANDLRIADRIGKIPHYSQWKFAVLGALSGCRKIWEFLPEHLRRGGESEWERLYLDTKSRSEAYFGGERVKDLASNEEDHPSWALSTDSWMEVAGLRYLLESRGVHVSEWSVNRGLYLIDFQGSFEGDVVRRLHEGDADLRAVPLPGILASYYQNDDPRTTEAQAARYCSALKAKSLQALAGFHDDGPPPEPHSGTVAAVRGAPAPAPAGGTH
jgi:hypothetical protein